MKQKYAQKIFSIYAWCYLILNLIVILGGAVVRATGSGAGCGEHWPLCNGVVLPNLHVLTTLIEFTHRAGSGVVGFGGLVLLISAFVLFPKHHPVRYGASVAFGLVVFEALLGAGLVLFKLVENDASFTRIWMMALHLTNTFLLLASVALTAQWASGSLLSHVKTSLSRDQRAAPHTLLRQSLGLAANRTTFVAFGCLLLLLFTGVTGALTALSDTLFKPAYVGENFFKDLFSKPDHILQMLRAVHPLVAIGSSAILALTVIKMGFLGRRNLGIVILSLIAFQIFVGMMNLALLTPIGLQLLHLFLADCLWIASVLYFIKAMQIQNPTQIPSQ